MISGTFNIGHGFGCTVLQSSSWSSSDALSRIVLPAIALLTIPFAVHYAVKFSQWLKHRKPGGSLTPGASLDDLKTAIDQVSLKLNEQKDSVSRIAEKIAELSNQSTELREAQEKILNSIYSQVNEATAAGLEEVLTSIKTQKRDLKSDFAQQIQGLTKLIVAAKEQPKDIGHNNGAVGSRSISEPQNMVPDKAASVANQEVAHTVLEDQTSQESL